MLNAVICALNSKYSHSSLAPWCLFAGIRNFSVTEIAPSIIEGTVNESLDVLYQLIPDCDVIGFCCYIWNIETVKKLAEKMKSLHPNIKIIFGGPEVSYNGEDVLKSCPYVDFIISGEGEKPIALLLDAINLQSDIPQGYGIIYRDGGEVITSEPFISCEKPPSPYCDEYFAALGRRIPYIETSRGCPYSCAFCLSGRCGGVRFFDMERTKAEILLLATHTTSTVKFVDRTFNANKQRSKEILRFIIENYGKKIPQGVCFHFEIAGDILDDETIDIINGAPHGSIQLEIGMQSFNERTLAYIKRKTDTAKLKRNILKLTEKGNIHVHIDLIAGLPLEDLNSFSESFNTGYSLNANMLQMGFLKLLHGADMRENSERYPCVFSDQPPYEVISTPWLNTHEMTCLHNIEDALDRLHNSGRFRRTLKYVIENSGLPPFVIFFNFGTYAAATDTKRIPLDEYTALVYNYFSNLEGIDKTVLRDKMVCDRFSTNSFGMLPPVLKVKESVLIGKVKKILDSSPETRQGKGIKRSIAILYSETDSDGRYCAVYADYDDNAVNQHGLSAPEYELHKIWFEK